MKLGGKLLRLETNPPDETTTLQLDQVYFCHCESCRKKGRAVGRQGYPAWTQISFGWWGTAPLMSPCVFCSHGFKTPGSSSESSCLLPGTSNEGCSGKTCRAAFVLKWLYTLIQIVQLGRSQQQLEATQHPKKCSKKTWNFYHRTKFWWFWRFLSPVQVRTPLKAETLNKEHLCLRKDGSIWTTICPRQPALRHDCLLPRSHPCCIPLPGKRTPNWRYMIAQCCKIPLQKNLRPNFTHKCTYATCTYMSESHVFISQGSKSTSDDPSTPSFFPLCFQSNYGATNIVHNIIQGFCWLSSGARESLFIPTLFHADMQCQNWPSRERSRTQQCSATKCLCSPMMPKLSQLLGLEPCFPKAKLFDVCLFCSFWGCSDGGRGSRNFPFPYVVQNILFRSIVA